MDNEHYYCWSDKPIQHPWDDVIIECHYKHVLTDPRCNMCACAPVDWFAHTSEFVGRIRAITPDIERVQESWARRWE